jgi:ferredoxin
VTGLSEIDGHLSAVAGEVPAGLEPGAVEAARSCPEQAISLS